MKLLLMSTSYNEEYKIFVMYFTTQIYCMSLMKVTLLNASSIYQALFFSSSVPMENGQKLFPSSTPK